MDLKNFIEFVKVSERSDLRFADIWRIYDLQFEALRDFVLALGDKYVVEDFTGGTSDVLTLENTYASGQLFLYINGVIQWKDKDYEEVSSNSIRLINPRKTIDEVKVVIVTSNIIQYGMSECINKMQEMKESASSKIEMLENLGNALKILEKEIDRSKEENKELLEEFNEKYSKSEENFEEINNFREEISNDRLEAEAYVEEMRNLKEAIDNVNPLNAEQILDSEVVVARNGAPSLGTRLNTMIYKFNTIDEMQKCLYLQNGDECIVVDNSDECLGISFKIFKICLNGSNVPKYCDEYYVILDETREMYAYKVYDASDINTNTKEEITGITDRVQKLEDISRLVVYVNKETVVIESYKPEVGEGNNIIGDLEVTGKVAETIIGQIVSEEE